MKYLALCALFGASAQAIRVAKYGDVATKWDADHPHPGYPAGWDDFEGSEHLGKYERVIPEQFDVEEKGGDQFMWSMYHNYAREKATDEGVKTGKFVFGPMEAKMGAYEILKTHMGLEGKAAEDYLDKNFQATFDHFDTAAAGEIDIAQMSSFYRYLTGNMAIKLH